MYGDANNITEITVCLSQPCLNNGTCQLLGGTEFVPAEGYMCDCAAGFKGTHCGQSQCHGNDICLIINDLHGCSCVFMRR